VFLIKILEIIFDDSSFSEELKQKLAQDEHRPLEKELHLFEFLWEQLHDPN